VTISRELSGALTLEERAAIPGRPAEPADRQIALQRLKRWRSQMPFDEDGFFVRRLDRARLDEDRLLALLGEPRDSLAARLPERPEWMREVEEAYRCADPGYALPFAPELLAHAETRFLWLAAPLIRRVERRIARVAEKLAEEPSCPFDKAAVVPLVLANLSEQLLWTISRVCVLELNIARLEERIAGETPEQRFDAFIALLRDPKTAWEILERYPVLARQLFLRTRHWGDAVVELLQRLAADWNGVRPAEDPGLLSHVRIGAGDRHRGNRTVSLLTFASGWRLVYKPRPQAIAVHFQELLAWMNEGGFEPAFRLLRVFDKGEYGWMEFAHPAPCSSPGEVRRFYQRVGGYLALLYALDAGDFHHENLIAAGEHPLLIDLESIVEPRPPFANRPGASSVAEDQLARSVLRIGLLPQRAVGGAGEGVDITALGMAPGQTTHDDIPYWEGRGTDAMHLERRPMEMIASEHRPSLDGNLADVSHYVDDLAEGFERAYRLIASRKGELDRFLDRMAGDQARVILRPTRTYGLLLQESFHPFLLREALERDRHFDHLWQGVVDSPFIENVIDAEREELLEGDIPLFCAQLGSRDLQGAGGRVWPGFLESSGLEMVRGRLANLDESDLGRQLWFIRAAVATHQINVFGLESGMEERSAATEGEAEPGQLLEAALAIGARLEALALRSNGDATWIGVQSRQGRDFRLAPLGHDLYAGLPGVVVFLGYLAEITGEDRWRRLARAGWHTIRSQSDTARGMVTSVGGFEGWGGTIWTLAHLSRLWDGDPSLLEEARAIVELLPGLIENDTVFDLMAGSAGCIPALLALHRMAPSDRVLDVARLCGERLLANVLPMERGASWLSQDLRRIASGPLTGFGHGAAGCAWALLELAAATGDERFRRAAFEAIEYERSHFQPELGTWRELRTIQATNVGLQSGEDIYLIAWCHGAPGVGLSRLRSLRHVNDPEMPREIDVALDSTLRKGFDRSHCLCHGDLGNVELFLEAGGRWRTEANRIAARVLEGVKEGGWRSGIPYGVEIPGLMTGLAGMGYGLLRLAAPERVPSVLLLDPPVLS